MKGLSDGGERNVRLSAKIICNERSSIFDCVVRSLSRTGARIEMFSTLGVPRTFHLRVKPSSEEYECQLVTRDEKFVTVKFGFEHHIIGEQGLGSASGLASRHRRARPAMPPRLR